MSQWAQLNIGTNRKANLVFEATKIKYLQPQEKTAKIKTQKLLKITASEANRPEVIFATE